MRFRHCILVILSAVLTTAAFSSAADKKQISDAIAAVEANLKTPAGKKYDELMGKEFPVRYLPSMKQCKQSTPNLDPFDMFLKLDAEGKVEEVLVHPETQFAICLRNALHGGRFSAPPHAAYWVNIHMQLKP